MPAVRPPAAGLRLVATALAAAGLAAGGCETMTRMRTSTYDAMRATLTSTYYDPNAEAKLENAEKLFADGEYRRAQAIFADVADNTQNPTLLAEKARFHEAECLRMRKRYPDAVATYNRLLMDFPSGAYRQQACDRMYEIAYGWLETETLADIESELAGTRQPWWQRKMKMPNPLDSTKPLIDTEGEALRALENVQTHDLIGPNADKALFWLGYVNFYRGRFEEADQYFSSLVEMHKDSKLRPVALKMAIMAKNNSTGGSVYDSTKASEALQLVHHAEATEPTYARDEKDSAWLTRQKMAIQMQLAEKEFRTAEYYERTNHLPSAYYCYELVCRRYAGTKYSDLAKARLAELDKVRREPKAPGLADRARTQWDEWFGKPDDASLTGAPAGTPTPPRTLPPDISNPR
jgi:TolA-binding protein